LTLTRGSDILSRLDAELARGWTLLRAVDYQLWGLNLGLTEDPALCATVIEWLSLAG
jgi:streptomycin 6-kinase